MSEIVRKSDTHYDEIGDLEIVSSDYVLFKVSRFWLQADSNVFRDMLGVAVPDGDDRVLLVDSELERAEIVSAVLGLFIDDKAILDLKPDILRDTTQFLRKYDFSRGARLISESLHRAIGEGHRPDKIFLAAAWLDNIAVCGRVIADMGTWTYKKRGEGEEEEFGAAASGGAVFDPGSMSIKQIQNLPIAHYWALMGAYRKTKRDYRGLRDYRAMSVEYMRLMNLKSAPRLP